MMRPGLLIVALLSIAPVQAQMVVERGPVRAEPTEAQSQQGMWRGEGDIIRCGRESKAPPDCGVDINAAPLELLARVPGLTRAQAEAIVRGRPYVRPSELQERGVIPSLTWDETRAYLYVLRASLNHSSRAELVGRLGLTDAQAARIVAGRPWTNIDDLTWAGVMNQAQLERLRGLMTLR